MTAQRIDTALIPIAGRGTRLLPVSAAVAKGLFPLVDSAGTVRAVVHEILRSVTQAGIERVGLIHSPGQAEAVQHYLTAARETMACELPQEIAFIEQATPAGFGHAVLQGESFADGKPFVLMLGDHITLPSTGAKGCVAQVADAFDARHMDACIGVQAILEEELSRCGVARGELSPHALPPRCYHCTDFVEKPDVATAENRLVTTDGGWPRFLAHAGIYAFSPAIFECLADQALADQARQTTTGEIELAAAQSKLLARDPSRYLLCEIDGKALDTGTGDNYAIAFDAIRNA